jgi:hypothetical protein
MRSCGSKLAGTMPGVIVPSLRATQMLPSTASGKQDPAVVEASRSLRMKPIGAPAKLIVRTSVGRKAAIRSSVVRVFVDGWVGGNERLGLRKAARVQDCHAIGADTNAR